jgi:hypothetical protein
VHALRVARPVAGMAVGLLLLLKRSLAFSDYQLLRLLLRMMLLLLLL